MTVEIHDNFLDPADHQLILETMTDSSQFPWYYNNGIAHGPSLDPRDFQFTHSFYRHHAWNSEFGNMLEPLLEKIKPVAILRIKANLGPIEAEHRYGGWHNDYEVQCKTAVYYVNTNNGWTEFKDGQKAESLANRLVEFDSHHEHSGVSQTDTSVRVLINLNYIK